MTDKERIRQFIELNPIAKDSHVAERLGVHRKTVWSVRQSMKRDQPAEIHIKPKGNKYTVLVNGRVWRSGLSQDLAEAEYEFLRWPKEPAA